MNALNTARTFIQQVPSHPDARVLASLISALENEGSLQLSTLYGLSLDRFELAVDIVREWRLDRYALGKAKVFAEA